MKLLLCSFLSRPKAFLYLLGLSFTALSASGQTNPVAQTLPYSQNFGTTSFSLLPAGWAAWNGLNGGSVSTQALAESSTPTGNATVAATVSIPITGGVYGYGAGSNGRLYVQTSGNSTDGVNQMALAINTTGQSGIRVAYDVEIISAQPRTVGIVMQYRVGTSGAWTTVSATGNPYSQAGGTAGVKANVSLTLPAAANNQPVVQLRWATWRGTEAGNSSGIAIDNISICPTPVFNLGASPSVCRGVTSTTLSYTATSGFSAPNQYSIDFNAAANAAGFADVPLTALPASPITIAVPGAAAAAVYNATLTIQNACGGSATANFTVTVNALPACSITGPDFVCNNTSGIIYSAPAGMSAYNWSITGNGSIPGSTTGQSVSVTSGNFIQDYTVSVTITDANGCISTCSKQSFIYLFNPPANITVNPNPACFGATIDLSVAAASSSTVSWTGEGVTNPSGTFVPNGFGGFYNQTTAVPTTTGPRTYSVTVTTDYGCINTGTASVTVNPNPTCSVSGANSVCAGSVNNVFTGPPGMSAYSWSVAGNGTTVGSVTGSAVTVTAGVSGTFTVSVTVTDANGCTSTCGKPVTVNANPACSITGASSVCANSTGNTYTAPAGMSTYSWSVTGNGTIVGAANTSTVTVTAGVSGLYTVNLTVTDPNGCSSTCVRQVTVNANPVCSIAGPTSVCAGSTGNVYSVAGGMSAYSWSIGGNGAIVGSTTGSAVTVTAGAPGTYTVSVTITNANGCTATCSQPVTVNALPTGSITGPPPFPGPSNDTLCTTIPYVFTGPPGMSAHKWGVSANGTINGSSTGSSVTITPTGFGTLQVRDTITDANGCTSILLYSRNIQQAPTCTVNGPLSVCGGSTGNVYTVTSNAGTFGYYVWSISGNGVITSSPTSGYALNSITVTAGAAGTYTVTVDVKFTFNTCIKSCSETVTINSASAPTITGPTTVCSGGSVTLDAGPGYSTYAWSGGGGSGQTATYNNITSPTTYTVTVTNNGCTGTGTHTVTPQNNPAPTITGPTTVCSGGSVTLDAGPGYSAYAWSGGGGSGQTATYNNITSPTTYTVTVTAANGCTGTDTHTVTPQNNPAPAIGGPGSVCNGGSATLDAGAGYSAYAWSGGGGSAQTATYNGINSPTTYTVTVTAANGCTGTDTHTVTVTGQSCLIDFSGNIKFSNNTALGVNNALVTLTGSASGSDLSDVNGDFFISTALTNGSFTLKPTKTANKLNGVTVADATAVQQHVSQANPITDPYKQVAADVNKSNSITTLDASIINQALLGNPSALAQFQTSWRFVPTSHTMNIPPWGFPEQRTYTNISGPQASQDFFGIKTGDIVTAFANPANFGAGTPMVLTLNNRRLEAGQELDVPVRASQLNDLVAFQCALAFDPAQLQLVSIEPAGGLPLSADNFGVYQKDAGEVRIVWSQVKSIDVAEAAPAFLLRLKALQSGAVLSEVLRLDGDILPALSYNSRLEESAVALQFESSTTGIGAPARADFRLLPNRPNPFSSETLIGFVLPQACDAQLRVFDAAGRELWRTDKSYPAGYNAEAVRLDRLTPTGVLYYELTTPFGTLTERMLRVE